MIAAYELSNYFESGRREEHERVTNALANLSAAMSLLLKGHPDKAIVRMNEARNLLIATVAFHADPELMKTAQISLAKLLDVA